MRKSGYRLQEVVITSGNRTVNLAFYPEPLRWEDIFTGSDDPANQVQRENLSSGRLRSLKFMIGEDPVFGEDYDEQDPLRYRSTVKRLGRGLFWEIGETADVRIVMVLDEEGSPLLCVILTATGARLDYESS